MKSYNSEEIINCLDKLGIISGDILYVSSSLFQLGKMEDAHDKLSLCKNIYNAIMSVIGENGTIIVPTFTPQTARYGKPFILEETKTDTGIFSEFVRNLPNSVRSIHPISSVAAKGKYANKICDNIPPGNWSMDSPSYRMYELNAKSITIGATRPLAAWGHLLETMYGVPYLYNKLLDVDVYIGGKKLVEEFYASVCYLDYGISYDFLNFEKLMKKSGAVQSEKVGNGTISSVSAKQYFIEGLKIFKQNPYILLKTTPKFRYGENPFDGITEKREKTLSLS